VIKVLAAAQACGYADLWHAAGKHSALNLEALLLLFWDGRCAGGGGGDLSHRKILSGGLQAGGTLLQSRVLIFWSN
jgi:hypothetical protein